MALDVGDGRASPLTLAAYRTDVKGHLLWLIDRGVTSVRQVTLDILKAYRNHLVKAYKITTARRKLASIRRFYAMARAHGALPADPAFSLKSPRDRTQAADRIKYLELDDLARLLDAAAQARTPQLALRDRAILSLMAYHGLRRCEIRRLDLADVDLGAGESGTLVIHGKGDKLRTVNLIDETAGELRRWLAVRRLLHPADDACFVQLHWNSDAPAGRLSDRALNSIVDGYLTVTGLKKRGVSCHTLRHTCATQALAAGGNLLAIGDALGHASLDTTRIYAKIVDRQRLNPAKCIRAEFDSRLVR
jgi:integrase/recombinase XerC/integrase/recombinase XerD